MYFSSIMTLVMASVITKVELAKILGIFPTGATNHFELGDAMMKELANRGHQVTILSPFNVESKQNYTSIVLNNIREKLTRGADDFPTSSIRIQSLEASSSLLSIPHLHHKALELTESLLADPNLQILLQSGEKFDVVVLEYVMNEAVLGVGKIFEAPVILFSPYPSSTLNNHLFSNPAPSAFVASTLVGYMGPMHFWQRVYNVAFNNFNDFYRNFFILPKQDKLLKTYVDADVQIEDAMNNVSLMLLNSHPSVSEPVPHTPNMIEVGGFHLNQQQELPTTLKLKMDYADRGVVFVTGFNEDEFYTIMHILAMYLKGMGLELVYDYKIFDGDESNDPLMMKFPRQAVLAHPNVKVVISDGRLFNIIEAVYFGIPVFGVATQKSQALEMAVKNGYALSLPYEELTQDNLNAALTEIMVNSSYRKNARQQSELIKDQPMKSMDSAMYWIEYVINHRGAKHLQSSGVFLQWYQRNLIDIILVLTILEILFFLIFYYILKHIIQYVSKKRKERNTKQYDKLQE